MRTTSCLLKLISMAALVAVTSSALATSMDDCRKRVVVAMENAKALGGTQADEEKLGNFAANECAKEVRESQQVQKSDPLEAPAGISPITLIATLATFATLGYFGWAYQRRASKRAHIENAVIAQSVQNTVDLRSRLGDKVRNMTIDQIAEATQATRRGTITWLSRNKTLCKDFDGEKPISH